MVAIPTEESTRAPARKRAPTNKGTVKTNPVKLPPSLPRTRGALATPGGPVIGVDEAGRGPWAGPVVAAAVVVLPGAKNLSEGITDSKLLGEPQRELVFERLTQNPHVKWSVAIVTHTQIDKINILQASLKAMTMTVKALQRKGVNPGHILVDGNKVPSGLAKLSVEAVPHGDRLRFVIAAASIIAKVTRDRLMAKLDKKHPQYGFALHKGYGTAAHLQALKAFGPCPVHRRTYEPIKTFLEEGNWHRKDKDKDKDQDTSAPLGGC